VGLEFFHYLHRIHELLVLIPHLRSGLSTRSNHQFEYSLIPIEPMFCFAIQLVEPFNLDRVLCRLLNNEIHRALSPFVGHLLLRSAVSALSDNVNQRIEFAIRMSDGRLSSLLSFRKFRKRISQAVIGLASCPPLAPSSHNHWLQDSLIPIQSIFRQAQSKLGLPVRLDQFVDCNRVLRLLLDDEVHRALSLFVSHRLELLTFTCQRSQGGILAAFTTRWKTLIKQTICSLS